MQCCHGDVMHVSELLNGCLVVDCHLLYLTHQHTQWCPLSTDQTSCIETHTHISHSASLSLSPVLVAESSAPPSLTDAPSAGVLPPQCDTSWAPPPQQPAPPPAAAAAPAVLVQTPPPAPSSPDGVSPTALSWRLCTTQSVDDVTALQSAEYSKFGCIFMTIESWIRIDFNSFNCLN